MVVGSAYSIFTSSGLLSTWTSSANTNAGYSSVSLDQSGRYAVVARATASTSGHIYFSSDAGMFGSAYCRQPGMHVCLRLLNIRGMLLMPIQWPHNAAFAVVTVLSVIWGTAYSASWGCLQESKAAIPLTRNVRIQSFMKACMSRLQVQPGLRYQPRPEPGLVSQSTTPATWSSQSPQMTPKSGRQQQAMAAPVGPGRASLGLLVKALGRLWLSQEPGTRSSLQRHLRRHLKNSG